MKKAHKVKSRSAVEKRKELRQYANRMMANKALIDKVAKRGRRKS